MIVIIMLHRLLLISILILHSSSEIDLGPPDTTTEKKHLKYDLSSSYMLTITF